MPHWIRKQSAWAATWFFCAACVTGCSGRSATIERFTPEAGSARVALEAALNEWQNGQPPGEVTGAWPAVQVVDTHRRPQQRLVRFELLGEVGGDAGRCFSVRLTLANPDEEQKVRFVVVGISPLWVFREEDFTMLTHWEHPMPAETKPDARDETPKERS